MDYSQYGQYGGYPPAPPGYGQQYNQQQLYAPPQIQNPFGPAPTAYSTNPTYDPEYEAQLAQWQSAYAPPDEKERNLKREAGKFEKGAVGGGNPNLAPIGVKGQPSAGDNAPEGKAAKPVDPDKKVTVVRKGGGQTWEDNSLLEWDPNQFRIMVGNLAGEVTDESLAKAFAAYGVSKARVVRDKRTTKSKGFGFVSFMDGELGFKAAREMVGKYIGSHPVTIQRSKTDLRPVVHKDNRQKGKGKNNKDKGKKGTKGDDPLRANTGAHIEKKAVRNPAGSEGAPTDVQICELLEGQSSGATGLNQISIEDERSLTARRTGNDKADHL
ncbi:hypothetical protein LTR15_004053 [Elasticomyces elasticus]|nr:hypothetical protein LTR15_004053 [Elasticomyces elasticus]